MINPPISLHFIQGLNTTAALSMACGRPLSGGDPLAPGPDPGLDAAPGDIVFAGGAFTLAIFAAKLLVGARRPVVGKAAHPTAAE